MPPLYYRAVRPHSRRVRRGTWSAALRAGLVLAGGAVVVRAAAARLPGLNPPSLWHDDLVFGSIIRSERFLDMVTVPVHVAPGLLVVWRWMYTLLPDPEWSLPAPAVRLRRRGDSTDGARRLAPDGRRRRHAAGWSGHLARAAPCALLGLCPPVRDRSGHHRVVPAGRDAAGARRNGGRRASVPARGARRGYCRVLRRAGRFRHVPDREPGRALRRAGVGDAPASGARHPLERRRLQRYGGRRVVAAAQPDEPNSPRRLRGRVHASRLRGRGVELPDGIRAAAC